ncbi:type 1 glutamine amidotransferase [Desulfosarcina cetonica]|uniref:type 1 glutamine amidotransferase n=1 Tax=Desulfosarcina cetonica TaxID=90730 RepID=UPI000A7FC517|nr:hypothetical protein [Desulfosarcina cetonica]
MRAHYFQHVPFEGLGSIQDWLETAGYTVTATRFFEPWTLPALEEIDFLVVMGGPMSVNDTDQFDWLVAEKQFIHDAVMAGKAVLGICLGAQLIASALGARVYPNPVKEIGWFPIQGIASPDSSGFRFPPAARCSTGTGRPLTCRPVPSFWHPAQPAPIRPFNGEIP